MERYRVLLVDDEEDIRVGISRKMDWESLGFTLVGEAENGQEALELAEALSPDVVLTDIKMPFLDGLSAARMIHEEGLAGAIIMLTAYSERDFIEYFLRDAYEYYGYSFQQYDGEPVDEAKAEQLISEFTTMNHYIRETWRYIYEAAEVTINGERVDEEKEKKYQNQMLEDQIQKFNTNRFENAKILLRGLHFVNKRGQPLYMMPMLEPDPALLEQPLYH